MSCECGCGMQPNLALQTKRAKGWIKGQPLRYIFNHHKRGGKPSGKPLFNKILNRWFVFDRRRQQIRWGHIVYMDHLGGEELPEGSIVHHWNGDSTDDSITNLILCRSQEEHMRFHARPVYLMYGSELYHFDSMKSASQYTGIPYDTIRNWVWRTKKSSADKRRASYTKEGIA